MIIECVSVQQLKRRLLLLTLIFMISNIVSQAQNLIPNPSFEQYKKLHCEWIRAIVGGTAQDHKKTFDSLLYDWVEADDGGGVELFSALVSPGCYKASNICNTSFYCTTNPVSIGAFPKDGNNICLISLLNLYKLQYNGRAYLQTPLLSKLTSGSHYLAGLYTMLPNTYYGDFACNNLGMFFSPKAVGTYTPSNSYLISEKPQVNQEQVNTDHGVWKKIFGCFTANGDEQYLTLGNFYDNEHTEVQLIVPHYDLGSDFATYVVDSVFTEEVKNPFIPNVFTPNGDGQNEKFVIKDIHSGWWSLTVVNRWGKQVYFSNDYRNTWNGGDLNSGVYYYVLQHRCREINYKGSLTILR